MFRECLCVVARQLAPKCRDFSNVAKLARQCKWPYYGICETLTFICMALLYIEFLKYNDNLSGTLEHVVLKVTFQNVSGQKIIVVY